MLAETIDYTTLETLFDALKLNRATGYRYLKRISKILSGCEFWKYEFRDGSLNNDGIKIFEIFTTIALEHSPKFAEKQLIEELKKHGYNITQNQQANNRTNTRKHTGNRTNEQSNNKSSDFYNSLFRV